MSRDLILREYKIDMWKNSANSKKILHYGTEIGSMVVHIFSNRIFIIICSNYIIQLLEYRTRLPIHEQSKAILELAISNDTEFLSKCNIMDYSLLVGIDQDKHEMTVGIVG
jgi:hypothetical protein